MWQPQVLLVLGTMLLRASAEVVVPAASSPQVADFSQPGPCSVQSWKPAFTVPDELRAQLPATLALNVTIPQCASGTLPFGSPHPVLFFLNGFQARDGWYYRLVQHAASWGLVTVQYDTPTLSRISIAAEVQLFDYLAQWVADQNDDPLSQLHGVVDPARFLTAGHSRGGKLAALIFTGNQELVQAAYLADPVDITRWSPETADNPSAARALEASGWAVGMSAAGIVGSCNPAESGYQTMFAAAGNGSWLGLIPGASHSQWMDAGCVANAAADLLCGRGRVSRGEVAELTATPMLAWFWEQLVGQQQQQEVEDDVRREEALLDMRASGQPSRLAPFFSWVQQQAAAGKLEFEIKGSEQGGVWELPAGGTALPPIAATAPGAEQEDSECAT